MPIQSILYRRENDMIWNAILVLMIVGLFYGAIRYLYKTTHTDDD